MDVAFTAVVKKVEKPNISAIYAISLCVWNT